MASGPIKLTLSVHIAWWLRPYLFALSWFAVAMGLEPNPDTVQRAIRRAVKTKVVNKE